MEISNQFQQGTSIVFPCQEHLWGLSKVLYAADRVEVWRCAGRAGGASSLHFHRHYTNGFHVLTGTIQVANAEEQAIEIGAGECLPIPSGVPHRLIFVTDAVLLEIYHSSDAQISPIQDIVRIAPGRKPSNFEEAAS